MWQANRQGRQLHSAAAERLGRTLDQPCGDVDPGHSIAAEMGHIHGAKSLQLSQRQAAASAINFQLGRGRAARKFMAVL